MPSESQREQIEQTARQILNIRKSYPDNSLAALYGKFTMPRDLRRAHAANDRAVMEAYGFPANLSDDEIVARLFELYGEMTKNEK